MRATRRPDGWSANLHMQTDYGRTLQDTPFVEEAVPLASGVRALFIEHRALLLLALSYIAVAGAVLIALGRPWPITPFARTWTLAWLGATGLWLAALWVRHPARLRTALVPHRIASALVVVVLIYPFQVTFQSLKQAIGPTVGFPWDRALDRFDRTLHGGPVWRWFEPLLDVPAIVHSLDLLYMFWFGAFIVVVIWLSWTSRRELRQRSLVALVLLWMLGGTLGAWLFASAGPCYTGDVAYAELLDKLDASGPTFARGNQAGLLKLQQRGEWGPLAGISAMPSMHVGLAVLIALIAWRRNRFAGGVLSVYAVVMQIGSVVLAWHYAVDGYAGALIAVACWRLAGSRLLTSTVVPNRFTAASSSPTGVIV